MRGNYCVSSGKCVPLAHCSCPFPQPENKTTKKQTKMKRQAVYLVANSKVECLEHMLQMVPWKL